MNILTIDTVLNKTYISFFLDGKKIYKTIESDEKNYHSAYLIKVLSEFLKDENIQLKDFDYIGTNTGVGSFTGIRAGLAVVKVIADRLNIKTVPFNTFEVLSCAFNTKNILIDAKRKNLFYSKDMKNIEIITYDSGIEILKEKGEDFICDSCLLNNEYFTPYKSQLRAFEEVDINLSEIELELTLNKIKNGEIKEGISLQATYIQTPPIFAK